MKTSIILFFGLSFFTALNSSAQNYRVKNAYIQFFNGIEIIPLINTSYIYSGTNGGAYKCEADFAGTHPEENNYQFNPINYDFSFLDGMDGTTHLPIMKYTKQYNEHNKVTEYLEQAWDGYHYMNYRKTIYTYEENNMIKKALYGWDVTTWYIFAIIDFIYSDVRLTEEIHTYSEGAEWLNSLMYAYSYDSLNRLASYELKLWEDDAFQKFSIYTLHYKDAVHVDTINYGYIGDTSYVTEIQYYYSYNEDEKIQRIIVKNVPGSLYSTYNYSFDDNGNISTVFRVQSDTPEAYETTIITWEKYDTIEHTFSSEDINIYPNPVHDELYISFDNSDQSPVTINIYDLYGELVNTINSSGNQIVWNLTNASGGRVANSIYIIKFAKDNDSINTKKIIVV
ncbi:MAG: T9SS type A sorting domain-containing protein [Fimbriimonadaceae bacterium]|nr:T9SS type A sorting domain-containing protein [Chitinophagales bacterium]